MKSRKGRILFSAACLLVLWQLLASWIGYSFILPPPLQVMGTMLDLLGQRVFYEALLATVARSILTLILAFVSAALLAWLSWKKQLFADLFAPLFMIMRSVPNISYILLILYWFSRDISSVLISFLILFPIIYQNLLEAWRDIDREYLNVLRIYPRSIGFVFFHVYLPLLRPAITASLCTGIAMAFKVGVMSEILGQVSFGVGRQMQLARLNFDLGLVMAWTGWIIIVLAVCDRLMKRAVRWLCMNRQEG